MPGTARSGHQWRLRAKEVGVNVADGYFRGQTSPEPRPDTNGLSRGSGSLSQYPERGSNPHGAKHQGILSHSSQDSGSVPTYPYRGETGSGDQPDSSASVPKTARQFPEESPDRLWSRVRDGVDVVETGCWLWRGAKNSRGYGQMAVRVAGRQRPLSRSVHRIVAELSFGAIPDGMYVCHHCDVRACANPDHLYVGTAKSNAADAVRRGRASNKLAAWNASKTHCRNGHPYSESNTYRTLKGERQCRACRAVSNRATYARKTLLRQERAA